MKSRILFFAIFAAVLNFLFPQIASAQKAMRSGVVVPVRVMGPRTTSAQPSSVQKGIHIKGTDASLNWNVTDGAGYKWSIDRHGIAVMVDNNAYSQGMQLQINHNQFNIQNHLATLAAGGREIELGPWNYNNQFTIYRRIYIDPQTGFARWIDIFENESGGDQTLNLKYDDNFRITATGFVTTSGKDKLTPADWGFVTEFPIPSSKTPTYVAHIYSSQSSKIKPTVRAGKGGGSNRIVYNFSIPIPAGQTRAICLYDAQRKTSSAALKFAKEFDVEADLATLPLKLRKIIVNMSYTATKVGAFSFPRSRKCDIVVMKTGEEITGSLENQKYTIKANWGVVDIPPQRVIGIAVPGLTGDRAWVVLDDGEIICGELQDKTVKIKIPKPLGKVIPVKIGEIATVSYRITDNRGEEITTHRPMVVLLSGEQLKFDQQGLSCEFLTEFSKIRFAPGDLDRIEFVTPKSSLHRAVLGNGSVMTGLMLANPLELKLDLGPQLCINRHGVRQLLFASTKGKTDPLITLTLRNGNKLRGRLDEKQKFTILQAGGEKVVVEPSDFKILTRKMHYLDHAKITTRKGKVTEGKLENKTIGLRITEGTTLWVPFGNVRQIAYTPPATKPAPTPKPAPAAPDKAKTEADVKKIVEAREAAEEKARKAAAEAK